MTTTVFTDDHGIYRFPALPPGAYHIWAQTTGYRTVRADARLAAGAPPGFGWAEAGAPPTASAAVNKPATIAPTMVVCLID